MPPTGQVVSKMGRHRCAVIGHEMETVFLAPLEDGWIQRSERRRPNIPNAPDYEFGQPSPQLGAKRDREVLVQEELHYAAMACSTGTSLSSRSRAMMRALAASRSEGG